MTDITEDMDISELDVDSGIDFTQRDEVNPPEQEKTEPITLEAIERISNAHEQLRDINDPNKLEIYANSRSKPVPNQFYRMHTASVAHLAKAGPSADITHEGYLALMRKTGREVYNLFDLFEEFGPLSALFFKEEDNPGDFKLVNYSDSEDKERVRSPTLAEILDLDEEGVAEALKSGMSLRVKVSKYSGFISDSSTGPFMESHLESVKHAVEDSNGDREILMDNYAAKMCSSLGLEGEAHMVNLLAEHPYASWFLDEHLVPRFNAGSSGELTVPSAAEVLSLTDDDTLALFAHYKSEDQKVMRNPFSMIREYKKLKDSGSDDFNIFKKAHDESVRAALQFNDQELFLDSFELSEDLLISAAIYKENMRSAVKDKYLDGMQKRLDLDEELPLLSLILKHPYASWFLDEIGSPEYSIGKTGEVIVPDISDILRVCEVKTDAPSSEEENEHERLGRFNKYHRLISLDEFREFKEAHESAVESAAEAQASLLSDIYLFPEENEDSLAAAVAHNERYNSILEEVYLDIIQRTLNLDSEAPMSSLLSKHPYASMFFDEQGNPIFERDEDDDAIVRSLAEAVGVDERLANSYALSQTIRSARKEFECSNGKKKSILADFSEDPDFIDFYTAHQKAVKARNGEDAQTTYVREMRVLPDMETVGADYFFHKLVKDRPYAGLFLDENGDALTKDQELRSGDIIKRSLTLEEALDIGEDSGVPTQHKKMGLVKNIILTAGLLAAGFYGATYVMKSIKESLTPEKPAAVEKYKSSDTGK